MPCIFILLGPKFTNPKPPSQPPQNPANRGNGSPNPNPSAIKKQMGQTTCSTAPSRALQRKKQQMW